MVYQQVTSKGNARQVTSESNTIFFLPMSFIHHNPKCNFYISILVFLSSLVCNRLRKVKMDQRKLMDNANTITDMAKVNI